MKKHILFLTSLFFILSLPIVHAEEAQKSDNKLVDAFYQSAYLFETSGDYQKASEGYLFIIANYPEDQDVAKQAFEHLKIIYNKFLNPAVPAPGEVAANITSEQFFTSLRNVYQNYKTEGQYDKAIKVIKYLSSIHERPEYLSDLGNIYLYGLNDQKRAIEYFEKSILIGNKDYKIYTDLGLSYELFGDYDKAIASYKKASEISPSDSWVIYGLKRIKGIELAKSGQLVKDWFFIGPLGLSELKDESEKGFLDSIDVTKAYTTLSGEIRFWLRPYSKDDYGYVNLNSVCQPKSFTSAYALTYIYAPHNMKVLLKTGSDDGIVIWVNGKEIFKNEAKRPAMLDDDIVETDLVKGWNEVILKVLQDWGGWGFYFRITDKSGDPIDELIFDPARDDVKAHRVIKEKEKEKFLKDLGSIFIYGGVCVIAILFIYLIIINIRNAARIRQMRKDFSNTVTHDLKVPVTAIMASAEMLLDDKIKDADKQKVYYKAIVSEAGRLNRYINKILEFARDKKRRDPYKLKIVNIIPIIKRSIQTYKEESPSDNIDISAKIEKEEIFVKADEEALSQAIINLLSNADKYSPEDKRIIVSVNTTDGDKLLIAVKDNGMGIAKKDINNIFKKYYRASGGLERKIQGIGLGLAFVKNIVDYHGGKIRVESNPGSGSTFIIELPIGT